MQQGGDSVQLFRVDGTVVVDFVDVGAAASQHPGKGDNGNALSLYLLPDEVADVQSFHFFFSVSRIHEKRRVLLRPILYQVSPNTSVETSQKEIPHAVYAAARRRRGRMRTYYIQSGGIFPLHPST